MSIASSLVMLAGATYGGGLFALSIATNQTDLNLNSYALANGWDGASAIEITVEAGVVISSSSTSTPALTVNGTWPNGVSLVNNGTIVGKGGSGGADPSAGLAGGPALSASVPISVDNQGTIGGGGGGGGAGRRYTGCWRVATTENNWGVRCATGKGGTGGTGYGPLSAGPGRSGIQVIYYDYTRIYATGCRGGTGGAMGAAGGAGTSSGYSSYPQYGQGTFYSEIFGSAPAGGSGGYAVSGNSNITWTNTGTRLGGIA